MLPNSRRPSHYALIALLGGAVLGVAMLGDAICLSRQRGSALTQMSEMVGQLQLTDLCLFTEARYTRHLSQADLNSAFQDHPFGLEHFPSGSLVAPPAHLTAADERLDRETTVPD